MLDRSDFLNGLGHACLLASVIGVGCAVNMLVPARPYDLQSADVINATFNFHGTTHGTIDFVLASGEHFTGEYHTTTGGASGWGSVYSLLWAPGGAVTQVRQGHVTVSPNEYTGTAIARSGQGRLFECEYVTNNSRHEPHGQGACRDNQGRAYKLMF
jgi:hypothetical protein